jgi:hypothetical protein
MVVTAVLLVLFAWAFASLHQPTGTQALFTSRAQTQQNSIEGGIWAPDPPAACGDLKQYAGVVYGTMGDDILHGGNRPQIIMGLDGNDTIYGGNSGDCLVGGPGDDHLIGGNSKDILLGGLGDDYLDGGNAKDYLDGEDDADECNGGNGKDDVVNCDPPAVSPLGLSDDPASDEVAPDLSTATPDQPTDADTSSESLAQPSPTTPTPSATEQTDAAGSEAPSTPEATP